MPTTPTTAVFPSIFCCSAAGRDALDGVVRGFLLDTVEVGISRPEAMQRIERTEANGTQRWGRVHEVPRFLQSRTPWSSQIPLLQQRVRSFKQLHDGVQEPRAFRPVHHTMIA